MLLIQAASLFAAFFPRPTGQNALEDYVRAAEVVLSPAFRPYVQYRLERGDLEEPPVVRLTIPHSAPSSEPGRSRLADDRLAAQSELGHWTDHLAYCADVVERFGGVLDLVRAGNAKPIVPSPDLRNAASGFESVTNVALAGSDLRFAQGRTADAFGLLLDQLEFLDNLGRSETNLVPTEAGRRAVMTSFARHLGALSLADCAAVRSRVASLLARPVALRDVALLRRGTWEANLREEFAYASGPSYDPAQRYASPFTPALIAQVRAMPPLERRRLFDDGLSRALGAAQASIASITGPERSWSRPPRTDVDPSRQWDDLRAYAAAKGGSDVLIGVTDEIAYRTRLRLLALSVRLRAAWFHEGSYPQSLSTLGKGVEDDPASGQPFAYRLDDRGFVVSSLGLTGEGLILLDPTAKGQRQ